MSLRKRLLLSLLRILCGVPVVSLLGLGLLFLVFSVTWNGRCVGLSAVLLGTTLYCSVGYWNRPWFKARRKRLFTVLSPVTLIMVLVPMALAPDGGNKDSRVRNCFLGGTSKFHCYSPWNVIPEDHLFGSPEFVSQKEDLRLLFLHGSDDLRIPCSFVEGTAKILRRTGYDAELKVYDGEDHYLILSQQKAVLDDLARFMACKPTEITSTD